MTAPAPHPRQEAAPSSARGRPRAQGSAPRQHVGRSRPARYPPQWPAEMQADVAAAFLDFATTGELFKAMLRNEAPRPSASRMIGGRRRPVWAIDALRAYVARRHQLSHDASGQESIEGLI